MKQLIWQAVDVATVNDLDAESRARIAQQIKMDYRNWRWLRFGFERVWREIDRHIHQYDPVHTPIRKLERGITIDGPNLMGSKLKMSNVYAHREGIVAAIMKYLMLNGYDFFDCVPLDPMDSESTEAVKEYLLWVIEEMGFQIEFLPYLRGIVSYGVGIASYEWVREEGVRWKTMEVPDPMSGIPTQVRFKAPEIIYDGPKFEPLNLYRTVIDPSARNMQKAKLIFQKLITPHEIMANPVYGNISEEYVFGLNDVAPDEDSVPDMEREQARGNTSFDITTAFRGKKKVYEAWGDFTDGRVLYQNYVAEVAGDALIRFEPNPYSMPYKPFIITRTCVESDRIYGPSPLSFITAIQAGYDTIINQMIDSNAMHNERPIVAPANAIVMQDKINNQELPPLGKNVVWRIMGDTSQISRMRDPDFVGVHQSLAVLPILENQMKMATGDTEFQSGGSGIQDQYATTGHVVTVAEAGNTRQNLLATTVEQEGILTFLKMTIELLRQRTLQPKVFNGKETTSGKELMFHPEMLMDEVKFTIRGASYNATRQLQVNAMQQFYTMLLGNPVTAPLMNWVKVIVDFGETLGIRMIRNQLLPQAFAMLQQLPDQQPTFMDNVINLFSGQQNKRARDESDVRQLSNSTAAGFGGADQNSTTPGAYAGNTSSFAGQAHGGGGAGSKMRSG